MASSASWVAENCGSVGYDAIALTGAIENYTTFSSSVPSGEVYYSIKDTLTGDREDGTGVFDGASTILRSNIHATLIGGEYRREPLTGISLSGSSVVTCTLTSKTLQDILAVTVGAAEHFEYVVIDDYSVPGTYFKGYSNTANPATATWRVLKGVEAPEGVFTETLADGDSNLDNVWNDRLSLLYS